MLHVVKLGGSLLDHPASLHRWLRIVATGGGRLVVVPGGGPFADTVRMAQRQAGIDDCAAHRMALLAMEQHGLLLAALEPRLAPADSSAAMEDALRRGRIAVWMPLRMVADAEGIEASWDVTSDSLAAWLALQLGASALWLVKSCPIPLQDPVLLASMGIVDRAFPRFHAAARSAVHVLGPDDWRQFAEGLADQTLTAAPGAAS